MQRIMMSFFFSVVLAACGSGGSATTGSDTAGSASSTTQLFTTASAVSGTVLGTVAVSSTDGNIPADSVVTFGQVFAQGVAPASLQVSLNGQPLPTQVDVKRHNSDGSIRHAILSVRVPASSTALSLKVTPTPPSTQSVALSAARIPGGPIDYRVEITEAGTTYVATLKSAFSQTTPSPWLSGPIANEWRARVAPVAGSTPHPGLRVVFDARFYTQAQGRVSITVENVESSAARGDRNYDLRILDSNGNEVFSAKGVTQYFQTRLRRIFQFGGAKDLLAIADATALQNSMAIPRYTDADLGPSPAAKLYAAWQSRNLGLFGDGIIDGSMPDTGGRMDIGPLPGWTVIALLSRDPSAYQVMFDAADRAGVYSVHYRDSTTGDVISIDKYPTITTQSNGIYSNPADRFAPSSLSGTTPYEADIAHQPSLDYVPYIISGDRYYLDEMYFWADWNLISQSFPDRGNQLGWVMNEQLRGQAWALRSFGEAAWIAPDGDWQKNYFTDKINQNVAWLRANAMSTNPLGLWRGTADWNGSVLLDTNPDLSTDVAHFVAPWMHDFFAFTLSRLCEMGFDAKDLRDWSLDFTVKRFTSGTNFNRMDGTAYHLAMDLNGGQVIQTMADLYHYSFANRPTGAPTSLPFTNDPDGYGIQALAALGAAVDANLPNASDAYLFVRSEILKRGVNQSFLDEPTWNMAPRSTVASLQDAPGIYPAVAAATPPATTGTGTPSGYTLCAQENQTCTFSGTTQVAFGANGSYNYLTATNSITCNNSTFGDPLLNVVKACFYQTAATAPPPLVPVVDNLPRNTDNSIQDSWFAQLPLRQWVEVPGSRLLDNIAPPAGYSQDDVTAIVSAWGGAALDTKRNGLHLFGGGHGNGKWNGILFFSLDTYRWTITSPGTPIAQNTGTPGDYCVDKNGTDSLNADGQPMACHSYYGLTWIPERDELFVGMRHSAVFDLQSDQWRKPILDWQHSTWNNDFQAWAYKGKVFVFCGDKNPITGVTQDGQYGGWIFDPAGSTHNTDGTSAVGSWTQATGLNGSFACLWNQIAVEMPERGEVFRMRPSDTQTPAHVLTLDNLANSFVVNPIGTGWEGAFDLPWSGGSPPDVSGAAFAPGATRADDRLYILENADNGRLWEINPNDWSGQLIATTGTGPKASVAGNYERFVFDRKHGVLMTMPAVNTNGQTDVPNVRIIRIR